MLWTIVKFEKSTLVLKLHCVKPHYARIYCNTFTHFSGTIPLHSLLCVGNKWRNFNHGKSFTERPYSLRSHAGILKDFQFIQDVIGYLL